MQIIYLSPSELHAAEPFSTLFPIDATVLENIKQSIVDDGFDEAFPVIMGTGPWTETPVVVDGHTRLRASIETSLPEIPTVTREFETEDDAFAYAVHNQRDRRNLTDRDVARLVVMVHQRRTRGGDQKSETAKSKAQDCAIDSNKTRAPKSVEATAQVIGISPRKVEQALTVLGHATPEVKEAVLSGEKSINKAYSETQERRKAEAVFEPEPEPETDDEDEDGYTEGPDGDEWDDDEEDEDEDDDDGEEYPEDDYPGDAPVKATSEPLPAPPDPASPRLIVNKPTFNKTNENIEWAKWSWNPVTGCNHGCKYCYARGIAKRFNQSFKPQFHGERLSAPCDTKVPPQAATDIGYKNVFVCSMADLFGRWVPQEWIDGVLDACRRESQWNYLFLTKNPARLPEIDFPENAWVGTTVDTQARVQPAIDAMRQVKATVRFLSCEPMLERLDFPDMSMFDWVIIGGQSDAGGCPEFQPEWEWVSSLTRQAEDAGAKVYWKPNLTVRPRQYPIIEPK